MHLFFIISVNVYEDLYDHSCFIYPNNSLSIQIAALGVCDYQHNDNHRLD